MFDKYYYIKKMPQIELSYDKILHKKVHANIYTLIPNGQKVLAWFTYDKGNNICLFMHLNYYNNITKVEPVSLCYDKELSYNLCYVFLLIISVIGLILSLKLHYIKKLSD